MLVLSRNIGERIVINDNIVLTVLEIRGDRVRLGFEGPIDVPIHREELHRRLTRDGQAKAPSLELAGATA